MDFSWDQSQIVGSVASSLFLRPSRSPWVRLSFFMNACIPVYLSTCLPVYMSTCLPVYLSTYLPVCQFACLPVRPPIIFHQDSWLFVYMLSAHLSVCLSVCLSTCTPVHLPTSPPVYLSTCVPAFMCICQLSTFLCTVSGFQSACLPVLSVYLPVCLPFCFFLFTYDSFIRQAGDVCVYY